MAKIFDFPFEKWQHKPLDSVSSDSGGGSDDMSENERLAKLEAASEQYREDIKDIKAECAAIRAEVKSENSTTRKWFVSTAIGMVSVFLFFMNSHISWMQRSLDKIDARFDRVEAKLDAHIAKWEADRKEQNAKWETQQAKLEADRKEREAKLKAEQAKWEAERKEQNAKWEAERKERAAEWAAYIQRQDAYIQRQDMKFEAWQKRQDEMMREINKQDNRINKIEEINEIKD